MLPPPTPMTMLWRAPRTALCSLRTVSFRAIFGTHAWTTRTYNTATGRFCPTADRNTRKYDGIEPYLQDHLREPGQGLRDLRAQDQPRWTVWIRGGRGTGLRRALLGGGRPQRGTRQDRVRRGDAQLPAAAVDRANR